MADGNFMVTMEMCVFNHDRGVSIHPSVRIDTDDLGEDTEEEFALRANAVIRLAFKQAREQVLAVGDMHWIAEKDAEIERLRAREAKWIEEVQSRLHVCYVHGKHPATADRMKPATIALQAILRAMGVEEGSGS